jgi:hypothetical protein
MNSPQTIEKQKGNQALGHHNTVFSQLLKLIPRHEFETLAKQHHTGRSSWSTALMVCYQQPESLQG